MIGGGLETVVAVVAVLLLCSGSKVAELIVAVLLTIAPLATEHFTLTTRVMVADAPGASEAKVTARLFPAPLQTPPPVAPQETKVVASGRMSVTVTDSAASGPLLVSVIAYVRLLPAITGFGAAVLLIARSAVSSRELSEVPYCPRGAAQGAGQQHVVRHIIVEIKNQRVG